MSDKLWRRASKLIRNSDKLRRGSTSGDCCCIDCSRCGLTCENAYPLDYAINVYGDFGVATITGTFSTCRETIDLTSVEWECLFCLCSNDSLHSVRVYLQCLAGNGFRAYWVVAKNIVSGVSWGITTTTLPYVYTTDPDCYFNCDPLHIHFEATSLEIIVESDPDTACGVTYTPSTPLFATLDIVRTPP